MIHTTIQNLATSNVPIANITVNRNRVKTYGNAIYMKTGTNYEIELFNPTSSRVLATIEIDGKTISASGIVIKPGQRVYLERWIDEPKKFMFSTYEVENTHESKNAIAHNGKVNVKFFDEFKPIQSFFTNGFGTTTTGGFVYNGTTIGNNYYSTNNGTLTTTGSFNNTSSSTTISTKLSAKRSKSVDAIETGMSEKGESSNQSLDYTSGNFNSWIISSMDMQIMPESLKPVEIEKIRAYCGCGTRTRATSWKFCPSCGYKL